MTVTMGTPTFATYNIEDATALNWYTIAWTTNDSSCMPFTYTIYDNST